MRIAKVLVAVGLTLAGCSPDMTGVRSASSTGTLLAPPADRRDALADVREACGAPGAPSPTLRRLPYVQSVRADGAALLWTSTANAPERVEVWRGAGERRVHQASVDPTRYLRGARQHVVRIGALEPGTLYCYSVHDAAGALVYGPSGFRTAPAPGDDVRVAFAVLGDSGSGSDDQRAVAAQLGTVPLDFVLHVGDVAYPDGTLGELESNHFAIYAPLASAIPLYPSIGDHDDATGAAGPYREVFELPVHQGDDPAARERRYSFDWGPVHVLVLDAIRNSAAQVAFAERDLAASRARWKIVVLHEPPYSSGWHGSAMGVRDAYAPIFERHGVQLVLSGDDHHYERTTPQHGVTYVVTGGGGYSVRPARGASWTAFVQTVFHFTYVTVEGDVLRLRAIDATGREFDGVEIPARANGA